MGEIAALSAALCWAVSARLFQVLGKAFSPLALNFWKGCVSIGILLVMTQVMLPAAPLSLTVWAWLLFSGAIGIGLGDTFFFQALNKIGDAQTILIAETFAPVFTALLALAWIGEWLSWQQWLGVALVILSVDVIVKIQKRTALTLFAPSGYVYAALAALCQAVGAVISRDMFTSYQLDAFNASLIRLLGGIGIITVLMLLTKQQWLPKTENKIKTWRLLALAVIIGTAMALTLQMLAFSHTKAAIVQTLLAASVVFSLGVAWALGEKVNSKTTLWSALALTGVGILLWFD
ncbi:DMT family transporter [Alteromonas sp. chi3]|uniref:DMT family transporter n=1 Tax=Alteromonas gilva TaxID=2987522 RepID=A0ABT5L059_9ALTE|nr:DMT family transporter [Alteromonas gilva]